MPYIRKKCFYLLHVVPVSDDTMFDRIFEGKDTTLALGFIANIADKR